MLKPAIAYFKSLVTICLLVYFSFVTFVSPAQAGKFMASLPFDTSTNVIEVAAIYETSYTTQKAIVKSLKVSNKPMKKALGFKGFSLLQSQDGKQVIALSQWNDLDSYQAYIPASATVTTSKSKSPDGAVTIPEPSQTQIFEIVSAKTSISGAIPALRGKEAVVRFTQLTPKSPEMRSQVLTNLEEMISSTMQNQPIPQSVIVLKSLDSDDVAIMTNWNCSAMFEDVGKPEAIALSSSLNELVDNKQSIYNVMTIIPYEVKKDKESKKD
ncbi:MAG: hypothetical protein DCF20_17870 [Pseudanabaena sp.]|nr:MAG: hypothetical protein DCF20_17870 [Pseudanabaena sp.]